MKNSNVLSQKGGKSDCQTRVIQTIRINNKIAKYRYKNEIYKYKRKSNEFNLNTYPHVGASR